MASSSLVILAVACFVSLISPAISQTCSSLSVERTRFETCLDLPVLDSFLHYTYNASNSSLSVAFVATQSKPDGWVAWAINPTATRMIGSQAFLAYRSANGGAPVVKTYNISGYALQEGKLTFDSWNVRAESMPGDRIAIFASVKVPPGADRVNQVWQIGGSVTNGLPGVHPLAPANKNSVAVLRLTADGPSSAPAPSAGGSALAPSAGGSALAPSAGGSTVPGQAGSPGNAGIMSTSINFGVNLGILVLLGSIFIF